MSCLKTKLYRIPCVEGHEREIQEAAGVVRQGGLLGIPTETVYGLGADALNEDAVRSIYEAKGRPSDNPLTCRGPIGWSVTAARCLRLPMTWQRTFGRGP